MARIAIIGGTGLASLSDLNVQQVQSLDTPFGCSSGSLVHGELEGAGIVFLCRHGDDHTIPPHKINYRANIWALHNIGVTHVIAVACVGGINPDIPPKKIIIPNQIIDYTYSRAATFFDEELEHVTHIDFTQPYCDELRQILLQAAKEVGLNVCMNGTYGATQGPRLETAAEIDRLERDGCDIVGMTGMPEAALAKELELCYATVAISANWAAGRSKNEITIEEIRNTVEEGMQSVTHLLRSTIKILKDL